MCDELRKVLDMEGGPYTLVVTDPGGLSAFKPPEGVKVTALEQTTQYDRAARRPEKAREVAAAVKLSVDELTRRVEDLQRLTH